MSNGSPMPPPRTVVEKPALPARKKKATAKLIKRDGQIYVVEPDGREYFAKLHKLEDGRLVAQYTRIDAETGAMKVKRIPLRRKKQDEKDKSPDNEAAPATALPPPETPRGSLLDRFKTDKNLQQQFQSQKSMRMQVDGSVATAETPKKVDGTSEADDAAPDVVEEDDEDVDGEEEEVDLTGADAEVFEDEMIEAGEFVSIKFDQNFSEAEHLVIDYLPDEIETLHVSEARAETLISNQMVGGKGKKNNTMEGREFRWDVEDDPGAGASTVKKTIYEDDFEGVEPHEDGVEPEGFDIPRYNALRKSMDCISGVPPKFKRIELSKPVEEMEDHEKIMGFNELMACEEPLRVLYIFLEPKAETFQGLSKAAETSLIDRVNMFINCEVIIIRHYGLKRIERVYLPRLLAADFVGNQIKDIKKVVKFCRCSPGLYQLDLRHNDIEKKPVYQPLIAEVLSLHWYSGRVVADDHRVQALGKFGSENNRLAFRGLKTWERCLMRVPSIAKMTKWDPSGIIHLKLNGLKLNRIFVASMPHLKSIDVSQNEIDSLQGSGIEKLDFLAAINVSHNRLSHEEDLEMFQWCPALRVVILHSNHWPTDYRYRILWSCRNLRGKNHWPGLLEIDNEKVKRSEILGTHKHFAKMSVPEVERMKWQLSMITFAGHFHLRIPGFTLRFANLALPSKSFEYADVEAFMNLRNLDLSNNNLEYVEGLHRLTKLRILQLQGNPKLDLAYTLDQLGRTKALHEASFAPDDKTADGILDGGEYRGRVLARLFHHSYLHKLDGRNIDVEDRLKAHATAKPHMSLLERSTYQLNLKLTLCATPADGRRYHDRDVVPGVQWEPSNVERLTDLTNLGIGDSMSETFWSFENLRQLNLAHNKISDVTLLKLHELPKLEIVDVSFNAIRNPLKDLAAYFDTVPALRVLCLRGNPSFSTAKHRLELIGQMTRFHQVECSIEVVDTVVTVSERIEALKRQGGSNDECEALRLQMQLHGRLPLDVPADRVNKLVLNRAELKALEGILAFTGVKVLCLRHNGIKSIAGLEAMRSLELLDVRDNKLAKIDEAVGVIEALDSLRVFAALGNPFSGSGGKKLTKYRTNIINLVSKFRSIDNILHYIDDEEVYPDEIVQHAFPKAKTPEEADDQSLWVWMANIYRKLDRDELAGKRNTDVVTLDLSFRNIRIVRIEGQNMYPKLKKLSLAHNDIEDDGAKEFAKLRSLEELDLTFNHIKRLDTLTSLCDSLPKLRSLYAFNNPGFRDDSDGSRQDFLALLEQNRYLNAPLRVLNGYVITVDERIAGITVAQIPTFTGDRIKQFRTELSLEAVKATPNLQHMVLSDFKITSLKPVIDSYTSVIFLDLSGNMLETLAGQGMDTLPNLLWLDLRDNKFASLINDIVLPLTRCHRLKHLCVQNSTSARSETSRVADYIVDPVCSMLRGLESCDEKQNPIPLDPSGHKGANYLWNCYRLGPNCLTHIDLNDQGLEIEDFPRFCTAISMVPCVKLSCERNPWRAYPNFRFMLIDFCKTLQELDGRKVNMSERQNAQRVVNDMNIDPNEFALDKKDGNNLVSKARAGMTGAVGIGVAATMMSNAAANSNVDDVYPSPVGSILSKSEIVINFLQVYAILFTITIHWPEWWIDFNLSWVPVINFDLDFSWLGFLSDYEYTIKYVFLLALPFFIAIVYKVDPNEAKWKFFYTGKHAGLTSYIHMLDYIFFVGLSIHIGYVVDYFFYRNKQQPSSWDLLNEKKMPNSLCQTVIIVLVCTFTVMQLLRAIAIRAYRKNAKSQTYWYNFIKLKKKAALFLLTIAYQPICKNVLTSFAKANYAYREGKWYLDTTEVDYPLCMEPSARAGPFTEGAAYCCQMGMPNRKCLGKFSDADWYHYVSGIFVLFFVLGIPYTLYKLIMLGTAEIDVNFNVPEKVDRIKAKDEQIKEALKLAASRKEKKRLKRQRKALKKQRKAMWAQHCKEYTNEQNYLYASYTRENRTQKVKIMVEKCVLLMVTLYVTSGGTREHKPMFGFLIVFLMLLSLVIQRPFNDVYEDLMDIVCRFTNSFTAFVGIVAEREYSDDYKDRLEGFLSTSLGIVNAACVVVILIGFLALPFRIWASKRQARKEAERLQKELWDEEAQKELHRQQTHKAGDAKALDVRIGSGAVDDIEKAASDPNESEKGGDTSSLTSADNGQSELARKTAQLQVDESVDDAATYDTGGGRLGVLKKLKTASAKKFEGWDPMSATEAPIGHDEKTGAPDSSTTLS